MKKLGICVVLSLALSMLAVPASAHITDPGSVNKIINGIDSPVINPGESGVYSFWVKNPEKDHSMVNVRLNVSIYMYSTIDETINVSEMDRPPQITVDGAAVGSEYEPPAFDLAPNASTHFNMTISTEKDTPHGGIFRQASYFIRFWISFGFNGTNHTMISRGYISDNDWLMLGKEPDGSGINRTCLSEMGFDGLLQDSSFTFYTPLPVWPFYLLIVLAAVTAFFGVTFYVLDNPGKYPRLEKRLQKHWGKLNQFRRLQKGRFGRAGRKVDVPEGKKKGD